MTALQAKYPEKPSRSSSPTRPRSKRRLPVRVALFLVKFFAVLLFLCIAAVGGGLYWLRTAPAEKLILEETTKLLAAQGLELKASRLSGPLPQRIVIDDLSLADAQGQFLKAARVELRLNLSALLRKTVSVETVELLDPEVFRLPVLPPGAEEETPPESGGSLALPVNIDLAALNVRGGRLHGAVLQPEAGPDSPVFSFALAGSASLYNNHLSAALRSELSYADRTALSLNIGLGSGLDSGAAPGPEDTLDLDIAGFDTPGGLLPLLLNNPDLPALQLTLSGKGGLKNWRGRLALLVGPAVASPPAGTAEVSASNKAAALSATPVVRPDVLGLTMDIGLQCADGSLWKDLALAPAFSAEIKTVATPGKDAPPSLAPLLGERLTADAGITAAGQKFGLTANVKAPAWAVSILDTAIWPGADDPGPREGNAAQGEQSFKAVIRASVTDPAALSAALNADSAAATPFPLQSASLTADLNGGLSSAAGLISLSGDLEAQTQDRAFKASYALNANMQGRHITLSKCELRGLGVTAVAAANLHADTGAVRATADIHAPDGAEWQVLLAELAGLAQQSGPVSTASPGSPDSPNSPGSPDSPAPSDLPGAGARPPLGGELRLTAALDLPGTAASPGEDTSSAPPSGDADKASVNSSAVGDTHASGGSLRLTGSNMRWPTAQLAAIFGPSANISATLTQGGNAAGADSWTLLLEEARAGILDASGKAVFTPPSGKTAFPASAPASSGALEAEFKAGIADLTPLGEGLSGKLQASARAGGPLDALHILLSVDSSSLTTPNGIFRGLSLQVDAGTTMTPASAPNAHARPDADPEPDATAKNISAKGTLAFKAADSPGGPLSLSGGWQAAIPADGRAITASLNDFLVQGAGLKISASLAASIPGQSAGASPSAAATPTASTKAGANASASSAPPLSLKGEVNADVLEWQKLAALAGAPLSGGPARLRLHLDNAGGAQSASLDFSLQSLALKEPGSQQAAFSVENVSAALTVPRISLNNADPLTSLSPDFRLRTGKGVAGPLRWSGGDAVVKGSGGAGEFSLSLLQESRSRAPAGKTRSNGKQPQRTGQTGASGANAAQTLGLRGRYDLIRHEAVISSLALQSQVRPSSRGVSQTSGSTAGRAGRGIGFQLQKPLTLNYADGLRFSGLDLAFQPGGRLTAEATLAPGALRAKLDLQALPFGFFALFTDATLPSGELQASADISSSAQGPRGTVTVKSRIASTDTQTGLIKDGAAPRQTAPAANAANAASAASAAFDLQVNAALTAAPGASAVPGSGVRSLPGIIWLNGTGAFGRAGVSGSARDGSLAFQIPLRLGANGVPLPDSLAPMAASVHWNGPLENLWQAVPLPDRYLSGQSLLDVTVTGSMNKPKPALAAYIGRGRFEDVVNGVLLTDINLEARTSPEGNLRALLAAKDSGKGTLALETHIQGLLGAAPPRLAIRGQMKGLTPLHRDDLSIGLSGIFGVNGAADAPAVTADILVEHGEVILSSKLGGSVPMLEVTPGSLDDPATASGENGAETNRPEKNGTARKAAAGKPARSGPAPAGSTAKPGAKPQPAPALPAVKGPSLNLRISLPQEFFIRGMGLDSEWEGDLLISGPGSNPSLTGSLRPVRGSLDLLSKTFTITGGDIGFTGGMRINPLLNLELTYKRPDLTAIITAAGTAQKPRLILESRPPLPQDEILANVLFGKQASELSRFEAIQLANSLRELTNAGGSSLDVLTNLRKTTGLDVLRVGSGQQANKRTTSGQSGDSDLVGQQGGESNGEGTPALEAGKYINDSIYVGVEQGLTPDSTAVRVEVELFPSVNLQGQSSSNASEVGIGWKMDY